ncbi:MAG: double-stranded DNA-binding protein [Nitrososphaerota archaeon]|nr:double-stranded DNA-binding protein [Nitrososphaerota archaeon]MDG6939498.1 double-stranded DNA-binding protein [Nitrososphaerota archaeon]
MSSEDAELKKLISRRLGEMKRKAENKPEPVARDSRKLLVSHLVDRGLEVLLAAEGQYPTETAMIVERLADLYLAGRLQKPISGGELLSIFRQLGLRVRIETSIRVEQDGKFVDISEKFAQKD